eukprot:TRINITY_DN16992_c6_g1_i1.p1 TRINITY_DN16992_c6_g1~~TRINITY_DN16992_c6_g1_i1.p1  ORF type:complete len:313 (+),score=82.79 TRINITY_DN16992_c6_g1_i1:129-1067(+)
MASVRYVLEEKELEVSPSQKDGLSREEEESARAFAANLVQEAGVLLNLPQVTIMRAAVLLHRFWCVRSLKDFSIESVAGACLLLASKLDDRAQRPDVIINTLECLRRETLDVKGAPLPAHTPAFERKKRHLVSTEQHILRELGYHTHVEDPYKYLVFYVHEVLSDDVKVLQSAWGYLTDSLLTDACVFCAPHELALACLFLALRSLNVEYPDSVAGSPVPWWELFSISTERITAVLKRVARAYVIVPRDVPRDMRDPARQRPSGGGGDSTQASQPLSQSQQGLPPRGDTLVLSSQDDANSPSPQPAEKRRRV